MALREASKGRLSVQLQKDKRGHQFMVSRLVLTTFVGPCPDGMEGCHNDGNPKNNSLGNLRWDTRKANHSDKRRHGTLPLGSRLHCSKLTEAQVLVIKSRIARGESNRTLADEFGVSIDTIRHIRKRRTWGWLE
jgi:hypothetical protein